MPFIRTTTTKELTKESIADIKCDFGKSISLVSGKNEGQLMLAFHGGVAMAYKGDMDNDCAMVEVSLFGAADAAELDKLTSAITTAISTHLDIDPARIYVNYLEYEHWGVSGRNV